MTEQDSQSRLVRGGSPLSAERKLQELGIELPSPAVPVGNYVLARRSGLTLYVSGHGPVTNAGERITGKVGADLDLGAARFAARLAALNLLSTIRTAIGSLDGLEQIDRVFGMVNVAPGFIRIPEVIDGCSELLIEVFGLRGQHARSAVGMAQLPSDIAVEIEIVATLQSDATTQP